MIEEANMNFGGNMNSRKRLAIKVLVCSLFLIIILPLSAFCGSDRFIDSDDYKSKDFKKGILSDYNDLNETRDVNWAWIASGTNLADHKISIESFEDATDEVGKNQLSSIKAIFQDTLERVKGSKGALTAKISIHEVQKYSPGKAWIPFAGGHQMQAGVGVEVLLKDKSGKVVGKIRHFARNGVAFETAAQESADDIRKFINQN